LQEEAKDANDAVADHSFEHECFDTTNELMAIGGRGVGRAAGVATEGKDEEDLRNETEDVEDNDADVEGRLLA